MWFVFSVCRLLSANFQTAKTQSEWITINSARILTLIAARDIPKCVLWDNKMQITGYLRDIQIQSSYAYSLLFLEEPNHAMLYLWLPVKQRIKAVDHWSPDRHLILDVDTGAHMQETRKARPLACPHSYLMILKISELVCKCIIHMEKRVSI